jgi:hypothetical protein
VSASSFFLPLISVDIFLSPGLVKDYHGDVSRAMPPRWHFGAPECFRQGSKAGLAPHRGNVVNGQAPNARIDWKRLVLSRGFPIVQT